MADRGLLRRAGTVVLVLAALLTFAGLFQHGLWTPDEPREAEVGRAMLLSDFSAMPTLAGEPFLEKPPLYAWITAASYAVFGANAAAARLPAALFAIGAIWIAYLLGKRTAGRVAGLCAAAAAATMWQFAETTHKAVLDVALTFFVAAGHLAFLRLKDENRARNYVAIGVLSGLAFLTKTWIGPGLMCAPPILAAAAPIVGRKLLAVALAVPKRWVGETLASIYVAADAWMLPADLAGRSYVKRVLPRAFVASVLGVVAFGLPWVLALAHTPGGGWKGVETCLVTNTLGRSMGGEKGTVGFSGHAHWFGFYFVAIFTTIAPWILTVPAWFKGGTLSPAWRGGRSRFCGLMFVAAFLLLSFPSGKRELYLVPMLPALAVVPGVWLSRIGSRRGGAWDVWTVRVVRFVVTGAFVAIALTIGYVALGLPLPETSEYNLAAIAGQRTAILVSMAAIGLWVLGPHAWAKRRVIPAPARGLQLAASTYTLMLVLFGAAYPLLDPMRDMSAGARRVADLVPANEQLLLFEADETTRAIVPFYSGRTLKDLHGKRALAEAMAILESGATRHLIVMDKDLDKLGAAPKPKRKGSSALFKGDSDPPPDDPDPAPPETGPRVLDRLDLVEAVQVSATRVVYVYKLKP